MKKKLIYLLIPILFVSCVSTGGIEDFYISNFTENELPEECYLKENEEPKVYYSSNLEDDINFLKSNYYQILGYSSYNGPGNSDIEKNVINLCKQKKAQVGLFNYNYTDTRYGVYTLSTGYVNSYNIQRYDYTVILFSRLPSWYISNQKTGFEIIDLDTYSRQTLQRNTGVVVDVVYNGSKAFYANLIRNDVIIEINGNPIYSSNDYYSYINLYSGNTFSLKIIRNGKELVINY